MGVATYTKNEKDAIQDVVLQSGISIKPTYTPEDLERVGFDYNKDLADPGEFPFTRGIHPLGFRSRNCTTRLYSFIDAPDATNESFTLLVAHRNWGLYVAW